VGWLLKEKLPAGDPVARQEAVRVMRGLCLDLKNRHRLVIVPAALMLVGGLLVGGLDRRAAGQAGDDGRNQTRRPNPRSKVTKICS
jgi:hypothetical protein